MIDPVTISEEIMDSLNQFLIETDFAGKGGIVTDLDGTALHEVDGRIYIPKPVELGLKSLHDRGRPFVLNTLRFPLSVLRTFGRDWYGVSNSPIPTVTLNGSLLGYVTKTSKDEMEFEEIAAFPLRAEEIDKVLDGVEQLLKGGVDNVLLFYYPRDWRMGEIIWTPKADRVLAAKERYKSASAVTAVDLAKLRDQMHAEQICMIFLLIEAPDEQLMAYQHTRRNNFFTMEGVDKLSGSMRMAEAIGFDMASSIGAGDTELDRFLNGVALAVIVGSLQVNLKGLRNTIRLKNSFELGQLLFNLSEKIGRTANA